MTIFIIIQMYATDWNEKASIDSKISRGTFSAAFLIQCLNAMGVRSFVPEVDAQMIVSEPIVLYKTKNTKARAKS